MSETDVMPFTDKEALQGAEDEEELARNVQDDVLYAWQARGALRRAATYRLYAKLLGHVASLNSELERMHASRMEMVREFSEAVDVIEAGLTGRN